MIGEYDMLVLEELSYQPKSWLQKLFCADRQLVHKHIDDRSLDPFEGTLLPRFFRKEILLQAVEAIPQELIPRVVHHDHAILYLEVHKIRQEIAILPNAVYHREPAKIVTVWKREIGVLPNAVYHREPSSIVTVWKRNFRYGRSLRELPPNDHYNQLAKRRDKGFRKGSLRPGNLGLGIQSFLLLMLLKTAQKAGYWLGGRLA